METKGKKEKKIICTAEKEEGFGSRILRRIFWEPVTKKRCSTDEF